MRFITFRSNSEPDDPDEYWRRRFFILGGGLAVLMLLAWLFGGGGPSKHASQTAAARASMTARQNRHSLPGAAVGRSYGQPSASPAASPSASASAAASGGAQAGKAPGKGAGGQCAAGRVVLSLFISQAAYLAWEQPTFRVYAVSTSESACQMRYGPAAVRVEVTQHGKAVWDSSACPDTRKGARTVRLAPGVPQEVTLAWNRKASGRSCAGTLPPGGSGTFEAVAQADGHSSPVRPFKLMAASPGKPSGGPSGKSSEKSSFARPSARPSGKP